MENIIEIEHLRKSFGSIKAVDDLSFSVKKGELFAFLGVNGAGKSTTISIICGQLKKDGGSVTVCGENTDNAAERILSKIGVVFQGSVLDKTLTVKENLKSRAALYGINGGMVPRWDCRYILHDLITKGAVKGDTDTPERDFNPTDPAIRHFEVPTEVCDSIGLSSWGYRCREDYYQADELKRRLTRAMSRGGNYLLNVGPKADGDFPDQAKFLLKTIGTWYHKVKEALHATPCSIGLSKPDFYVTSGNHALYIIVNQPLESTMIDLRPFNRVPAKATLLNTGGEIEFTREPIVYHKALGPALRLINLPQTSDAEPTVIRLDF